MKPVDEIAIIDPVGTKAGMDRYDALLAEALQRAGRTVHVLSDFSYGLNGPFFSFITNRGFVGALKIAFELWNTVRWCKRHSIGQVIVHIFGFRLSDEWLLKRLKQAGIRTTVIVHDADPFIRNATLGRKKRILLKWADDVLVHNRFTADELGRFAGPGLNCTVIPHGHYIDPERPEIDKRTARRKLGVPDDAFLPLFFGMIKPTKGIETLLDALDDLPDDVQLLVAGRPRGKVRRLVERLKQHPRVTAKIGYVFPKEMEVWLAAADVMVLPYTRSYQSGVAIQAMSRHLPVILSDLPPHKEWIGDKAIARRFRTGDVTDLAAQINEVRCNREQADKMADVAFEFLKQEHDWNKVAAIITNLQSLT